MKKLLQLDIKYSLIQIFFFGSFCSILGYASPFLLFKGYNNSTIGVVLALANMFAVVIQPLVASYLDDHKNIKLKDVISIIAAIPVVAGIVLLLMPSGGILLLCLFVAVMALMSSVMPLMNSICFIFEKYGYTINYGLARGLGSVSYALVSLVLGHLIDMYNPGILPFVYVGFNILLIIVVQLFVLPKTANHEIIETKEEKEEESTQLSLFEFSAKYKKFMLFVLGFVGVYFAHTIINNFFIQIIDNVGGNSSDMGNAVFLAAMLELPTMAVFTKVAKKVNCGTLIKFSIIMFTLKHVITFFAVNVAMIYVAQALQMFAYALFIPASVYYVTEKISLGDQIKGQAMLTMGMTAAGVLASLAGGILLDSVGVSTALLVGVVLSAIGLLIVLFTVEKV